MQYVFITSAWIQLFIFQRNNGACWSLIATADKANPFPFVGHRNTQADIIIRSLICITDSLILLIEQGMQIWSQSGQEIVVINDVVSFLLLLIWNILHLVWKRYWQCLQQKALDYTTYRCPCPSRVPFDETQGRKIWYAMNFIFRGDGNVMLLRLTSRSDPGVIWIFPDFSPVLFSSSTSQLYLANPKQVSHQLLQNRPRGLSSWVNISMPSVCFSYSSLGISQSDHIPHPNFPKEKETRAPSSAEWTGTCRKFVVSNPWAQPPLSPLTRSLYVLSALKSARCI